MHEHDNKCACGHNHNTEPMVTLTLDDDTQVECLVVSIFPVEDKCYIALLPVDSVDDDASEIYIYQYVEHDNDDIELINIEDDEEFKKVSEAFDEILDDEDDDYFDYDMFDDEDDDEDDEYFDYDIFDDEDDDFFDEDDDY